MTDIVLLPLSQGKFAIIDAADFGKVGKFKWSAKKSGDNFYGIRKARRGEKRITLFLHCEIMGIKGVDHKSGDGLDCRRENLRSATHQQNHQAFRRKIPGASSKFRGVSWDKSTQKWVVQINASGKKVYVGLFAGEKAAARAYDKAATENNFFKEALNFP